MESASTGLLWDDLEPGKEYTGPGITVTREAIIAFALTWDMQPFHVDEVAAKSSRFGTLVASGLHSLMLTYRLYLETGLLAGTALAGLGIDNVRFHGPLKPDDRLQVVIVILSKRRSKRAGQGIATLQLHGRANGVPCVSFELSALVRDKAFQIVEGIPYA